MDISQNRKAVLLLEDGSVFHGYALGKIGTTTGEICFNTGMTGYQEIFTDPSYFGQILVSTNVHIGNYGIRNEEDESDSIKISGFVCKNYHVFYSRTKADQSIQEYFEDQNLVGIHSIDTRALVQHIRQKGAMNAIISSEIHDLATLKKQLADVPSMAGLELASKVTTKEVYFYGDPHSRFKVAVLDYGVKRNILRSLAARNCYLKVFPSNTSLNEILEWNPDGFFLSNGPGDPGVMSDAVELAKQLIELNKPLFGICLGHQIIALALGIPTYKLFYGHRGLNHPVKNLMTGLCEITSQNHGFGIDNEMSYAKSDHIEVTHINLNDDTVEGIRMKDKPVFSVQYHPEASPGPWDSRYLFDDFIKLLSR